MFLEIRYYVTTLMFSAIVLASSVRRLEAIAIRSQGDCLMFTCPNYPLASLSLSCLEWKLRVCLRKEFVIVDVANFLFLSFGSVPLFSDFNYVTRSTGVTHLDN